uniref:Uncharacterized protein n=1 Tax=Anguilla anguilla TaxID=7936 RepID=A0A0E9QQH7_ANGAN
MGVRAVPQVSEQPSRKRRAYTCCRKVNRLLIQNGDFNLTIGK